jgi:hypothetical protein
MPAGPGKNATCSPTERLFLNGPVLDRIILKKKKKGNKKSPVIFLCEEGFNCVSYEQWILVLVFFKVRI